MAVWVFGLLTGLAEVMPAQERPSEAGAPPRVAHYRTAAESLIAAATRDSAAYIRLSRLVDSFGPRLSGSASLEQAIDWILAEMKADGLDNVRGEPVTVPSIVARRSLICHGTGLAGSCDSTSSVMRIRPCSS